MLNIPIVVTARLKRDTVKKNFRVQFPNGEYNDITNESIVYESVRFSESICSQNTFRFGLAESSRIEFETVGIGNMLGMQILCFCEVDVTGENISALEEWTGDGEVVTLEDSDLGYPFFRIPYGEFVVQSCPRNHEAMTHRKVTAFSTLFHNNSYMCPLEQKKTSADWSGAKVYRMDVKHFMAENIAYYNDSILDRFGYDSKEQFFIFSAMTEQTRSATFEFYDSSSTLVLTVSISGKSRTRALSENGSAGRCVDDLLELDLTGYNTARPYGFIKNELDLCTSIDYSKTVITSLSENIEIVDSADAMMTLMNRYIIPRIRFGSITTSGVDVYRQNSKNSYFLFKGDNTLKCFYPNLTGDAYNDVVLEIPCDTGITIHDYINDIELSMTYNAQSSLGGVKCNKYVDSKPDKFLAGEKLYFNATLGASLEENNMKARSFVNAFSFSSICRGFCEINGLFLAADRNGGFKLFSLEDQQSGTDSIMLLFDDDSSESSWAVKYVDGEETKTIQAGPGITLVEQPNGNYLINLDSVGQQYIEILRSDYSEFWWDEYDIEPIGQINYSFVIDGDYGPETQINSLVIGAGGSVYDLSDNYVLLNLGNATQDEIEQIIKTSFAPAIKDIYFTPIELSCRGMPQLESGDYLKLVAADGTIVYSYALQCELSGIQNLQEYVESNVGEIISEYGEDYE